MLKGDQPRLLTACNDRQLLRGRLLRWRVAALRALERDDFSSSRHPALDSCLSKIFSENRYPLFGIMLERISRKSVRHAIPFKTDSVAIAATGLTRQIRRRVASALEWAQSVVAAPQPQGSAEQMER
jgi:hypothetical protein